MEHLELLTKYLIQMEHLNSIVFNQLEESYRVVFPPS